MNTSSRNSIKLDGRVVADMNDMSVLEAVNSYGHLRRAELAAACWPRSSAESAKKMCATTVKRLIASGELEERPNSLGGMSLILSPRGARRLSNFEIEADDGRSLSSVDGPQFYHRTLGNRYLIEKLRDGATAFSEYAFIKNRAPVTRAQMSERFNKFPDGLLVYPGAPRGLASHLYAADWVEVESSFKSTDDIEKMIRIATRAGSYLNAQENIILERVVFVFDVRQRHEKTLTSYLKREVLTKFPDEAPQLLNSIVFARVCIRTPLVWESYTEVTAAEVLLKEHQNKSQSDINL